MKEKTLEHQSEDSANSASLEVEQLEVHSLAGSEVIVDLVPEPAGDETEGSGYGDEGELSESHRESEVDVHEEESEGREELERPGEDRREVEEGSDALPVKHADRSELERAGGQPQQKITEGSSEKVESEGEISSGSIFSPGTTNFEIVRSEVHDENLKDVSERSNV